MRSWTLKHFVSGIQYDILLINHSKTLGIRFNENKHTLSDLIYIQENT